jgi:hypothetical protein
MKSTWNPVVQWLNEVRQSAEIESLSALQAKSVAHRQDAQDALAVRNAQVAMQTVRKSSQSVLKELHVLTEQLPLSLVHIDTFRQRFLDLCTPLCQLLELCRRRCAVNELSIEQCKASSTQQNASTAPNCASGATPTTAAATTLTSKLAANVPESPDTLYECVCSDSKQVLRVLHTFVQKRQVQNLTLDSALGRLLIHLQCLVERTLLADSSKLVDSLYTADRDGLCLKWSLLALWQLTQTDRYFRVLFATRASVLKPLANLLSEPQNAQGSAASRSRQEQLRCAALRVFTHLCARPETALIVCSRTAIGPRLTRLLNSPGCARLVQVECVRLIVQLTRALSEASKANESNDRPSPADSDRFDPFDGLASKMQHVHLPSMHNRSLAEQIATQLSLDQLVECLTGLLIECGEPQLLLLCSAAFANISFVDCYPFIHHRTLHVVLHVLDLDRPELDVPVLAEIPLLDQLLTLLANLAEQYPTELLDGRALQLLVQALQSPSSIACSFDSEAQERVQQKAATAIGRLVLHVPLASAINRMHVLERLIAICVDARLRNHSEHVLLAALAALRRAAVTLGPGPFERLQRLDLIQLPLRDAFTKYAAGHELYV